MAIDKLHWLSIHSLMLMFDQLHFRFVKYNLANDPPFTYSRESLREEEFVFILPLFQTIYAYNTSMSNNSDQYKYKNHSKHDNSVY